jgi:hypothetical protein
MNLTESGQELEVLFAKGLEAEHHSFSFFLKMEERWLS